MDDLERSSQRDGERWGATGIGQPVSCQRRLTEAGRGEGIVRLALETPLDDERRLAVPEQDERRVQAVRDDGVAIVR